MLITFPLLTPEELQQARRLLAGASWSDGRASAGDQAAQAKRNEQLPADCEASLALQSLVTAALDRSPRFLAAALPRKLFPPRFNRYRGASNHYGPHVDSAVRFAEHGVRVRTDLSCTVFLSAPESYDGGELAIHSPGASPERVKLPAGHAVLYPGTSVHEVTPVTRGERLASFFWVESMVRRDDQRRLLLELDDALVALRTEHGESAATVALTGTYHNLLRMWADT
ncbi:Fe2+-dependent dioxygenase [Caenimonas sedimenti]|uniref:Fe2+-dependent dioxygenase n=1 Tax=Caenimonas sedimenti TaxID=2596921 RepID=A0A562ZWC9_9BURK|nr:Fe2+-dependent dioxygenase [Caenimonas sedimenti]TWO72667.1 Fe2+-dependent dioxygenase [Caenimonas sedimenti]